ncbi:MAG TPA: hypothetical protein VLF18_01635 [Tahibacter sp.]|uniref:hypothetical protein n=1 Tax=Tahibacter sp. TaxID=2056211 RepID=UPI002CD37135|nr:hypothetical protein [Tahibacter sp.]HSX58876.1 hypothetical protein [Tahibacter sp.]
MNAGIRSLTAVIATGFVALLAEPLAAATIGRDGWSLRPPRGCTPHVERIDAQPTYDAQARAALARDPMRVLKPHYYDMPAHLRFDLRACYGGPDLLDASLRVFPVADYLRIFDDGRKPGGHVAKEFDALRRWLAGPPGAVAHWPMIPFLDMSPQFTVERRALRFQGGRGIRVVTQFVPDVGFATSRRVSYVFQGLSDDGRSYVLLTVPLTIVDGAADDAQEHLGFSYEQIERPDGAQRYERAVAKLVAKHGTTPALAELDAVVEGLAHDAVQRVGSDRQERRGK